MDIKDLFKMEKYIDNEIKVFLDMLNGEDENKKSSSEEQSQPGM